MGHSDEVGYMSDFCDGTCFKENQLFAMHKDAIQVILYYDELEICNPLGSKRTKHKLGMHNSLN